MKVSQKLEYACRAMIQLAKSRGGNQVSRVEALAERESVSATFLVQILNDLRRAGLVQSRRGKMGGYCLAKSPREINLHQIVQAIEGGVFILDSDRKGESGERVADVWMEIAHVVEDKMTSISLQEMLAQEDLLEYYI
jgi:Rrf2 family protein